MPYSGCSALHGVNPNYKKIPCSKIFLGCGVENLISLIEIFQNKNWKESEVSLCFREKNDTLTCLFASGFE